MVGGKFQDLADIIELVADKSRVGVCFDTCHAFAAGYDLRTPAAVKATLDEFDRVVGLQYLRAVHLNDSKGELGCGKDRHENIGKGQVCLRGTVRATLVLRLWLLCDLLRDTCCVIRAA